MEQLKKMLVRLRNDWRKRQLEEGEVGWGKPAPQPARLRGLSSSKTFRVGVIGAGAQGIAQCQGLKSIKGIEVAGLAEVNAERLKKAADSLGLAEAARYSSAKELLEQGGALDMVSIATTAPYHVKLGRQVLQAGVKRILLEKPVDNSLKEARAFRDECAAAGVTLAVNYSRRWMIDYQSIKRCLKQNFIGEPRSISVMLGKGELAMHGSHYFDLCCFLFDSAPASAFSQLEPIQETNLRGAQYQDPSGFCLFVFQNGARAFIDFSSDLTLKDPFITIKGTLGRITIDEPRQFWTLQSRSQRVWTIPFVEPLKSSVTFARVVTEILSESPGAATGADGVMALEMVIAAHLSQRRGNQMVKFPISDDEAEIGLEFP